MKKALYGIATSLLLILSLSAEESPIATEMDLFNDAYKAMKKETDPAKGAALARESQDSMLKALKVDPEIVQSMPEGIDKMKFSAEYRKMMAELLVILADIELAFLNNQPDQIEILIEKIRTSKKQGHDKFIEE